MVNRFAKKKRKDVGVQWVANNEMIEKMLAFTEIGDVWGNRIPIQFIS